MLSSGEILLRSSFFVHLWILNCAAADQNPMFSIFKSKTLLKSQKNLRTTYSNSRSHGLSFFFFGFMCFSLTACLYLRVFPNQTFLQSKSSFCLPSLESPNYDQDPLKVLEYLGLTHCFP
jgi:hypothetical protein